MTGSAASSSISLFLRKEFKRYDCEQIFHWLLWLIIMFIITVISGSESPLKILCYYTLFERFIPLTANKLTACKTQESIMYIEVMSVIWTITSMGGIPGLFLSCILKSHFTFQTEAPRNSLNPNKSVIRGHLLKEMQFLENIPQTIYS